MSRLDVAFLLTFFAFCAASQHAAAYIGATNNGLPQRIRQGTPCNLDAWILVMKLFARLFASRRPANLTTTLERQRLAKTMPGQTAALAGNRLGILVS